ncbi:arginine--tRNA ligase [Thiovibrio frasassiensis]|uniref:Arginine--tRNA ligase n=1 Tax=Thiovibrio frasassiensis TaxID=2984131 RepID=A0A9X4RKL6_9BACT|nr:arginine--tRNA ligase [Thiovibrio frasassiensis]MDG4474759.1 arginine--tRNA ligase [Thiovibrio frasassiensis]
MIKTRLKKLIDDCFTQGIEAGFWSAAAAGGYSLDEPKHAGQGDLATNLAMVVAGKEKKNPRTLAAQLVEMLAPHTDLLERVEIAGPGFVNCYINKSVWQSVLPEVCAQDATFGRSAVGQDKKVLVEFVSANPTGPLSVGHGRQAVLGDAIASLLAATGHQVTREYYYNDAGRQMRVLGESTRARYLEALGLPFTFPEDGYQGQYIRDIAQELIEEQGDALKDEADVLVFKNKAERVIFADINSTLHRLGIVFDNYYNEHSLYENGLVDDVVASLREKGLAYDQDGAVWFKGTEFDLPQDRVIIKSTGEPTYRLPDMAYHREKFKRGFDWMVDIFGSDHIATVPDVLAGVKALGYDPSKVTVVLHQFVTLMRDGQQVKMSTRKANFVTVDELLDEVGVDVARFFFLMRKADSQLEFDLDLATKTSQENPVYYVQYAHARLHSIRRQAEAKGIVLGSLEDAPLGRLTLDDETLLFKAMAGFPALVQSAALDLAPHRLVYFLQDLAAQFHSYYNKHRIVSEDEELSRARLWLAMGLRVVLRNGLALIGVSAPESM